MKDPETGVVSINEDRCTGCGECVVACPYGAMGYDPIDHHALKCDLCHDRREVGLKPACATVCPGSAITFGARDEVEACTLSDAVQIEWMPDGDHSLKPRKRSGRSESDNLDLARDLIVAFASGLEAEKRRGRELDDLFKKASEQVDDGGDKPDNPMEDKWR